MALRTFRSNPALGGFGGESSTLIDTEEHRGVRQSSPGGDAFAQIIKEIVDNAVDACTEDDNINRRKVPNEEKMTRIKRVRVVIERFETEAERDTDCSGKADKTGSNSSDEVLRVTVSDNGCGMKDIQACVDPFHTSKAHATLGTGTTSSTRPTQHTSGRYGIGLTRKCYDAQKNSTALRCFDSASLTRDFLPSFTTTHATYGGQFLCFHQVRHYQSKALDVYEMRCGYGGRFGTLLS
jgi:hypothetical protein